MADKKQGNNEVKQVAELVPSARQIQPTEFINPAALIKQWLEQCVIGLSLCPFAKVPYRSGSVRVEVYEGAEEARYLAMIQAELERLITCSTIETTLIAATNVLPGFLDFNDFLDPVEDLLQKDNLDMEFQLASFHPQYHFAGVGEHDPGNYTNRAPFPLVQWLRSDTVATAADATDTLAIPQHNIARLSGLDASQLQSLFPWVKTSDSDA